MGVGAPVGNKNASKDKLVEGALRRRLARNPEDADFIAGAMIERAKKGDIQAAIFVRDTVDGKPIKRIDVTTELNDAISLIGNEELRAAVRQRMAPFFREALRSVEPSGETGSPGHSRAN